MDLGAIIMLMIWQFYIYFLVDGFKGAPLSNTPVYHKIKIYVNCIA